MISFFIAAFLADFALGAVLLAVPFFLIDRFSSSAAVLGLVGALGALFYSTGVIVTGRFADRVNRKYILSAGCILFALITLILPRATTLPRFITVYPLVTVAMCMFWPVIQSWLSLGLDRGDLNRALSGFNVAWSSGLMLGYLSSGFLFSLGPSYPFIAGSCAILAALLLLVRQPIASEKVAGRTRNVFLETETDRPASIVAFLRVARIANFMGWFAVSTIRNLFPKLGYELSFSTGLTGTFLFLIILAQTAMFLFLGRTVRWHYRLSPLIFFQCVAVCALAAVSVSSSPVALSIAMFSLGMSSGLAYSSSLFYGLYGSIDKGSQSGIHEAVLGAGTFFGPLIGGIAAYAFGLRAPYISAMSVLAAAIVVEIFVYNREMRRTVHGR